MLKENYRQPYQITSAFISKLSNGPTLNTGSLNTLTTFAVVLKMCLTTLTGLNCVIEINNQHILKQIINRLPTGLQQKWHSIADNIVHEVKRSFSIADIAHFVRKQAREADHPIFGLPTKRKVARQKSCLSSTKTSQKSVDKMCLLCSAKHYINPCKSFRSLSYKDRLKFVIEHNLCFACLNPGHHAAACSRTNCCQRENCDKKHTTLLHPPTTNCDQRPATEELVKNGYVG